MNSFATVLSLAALATQVAGHGYLTSPAPRQPGPALAKACGSQINSMWSSDINGNIQTALQNANQPDFKAAECDIWLCKGMKFEDNKDNVQTYTAGQKVPIVFNVAAPHTGVANMSIVDTKTNTIIGSPLKSFEDYASTATGVSDDEKNFDITIPSDLGSKCATAGDCVLQFWWDAPSVQQTYESCIDFTVGGSGNSSPAPAPESSAPATPTASSPAATSAAATATATAVSNEKPSSKLPEEFTIQEFISWLKTEAGAGAAKARRHARAFAA